MWNTDSTPAGNTTLTVNGSVQDISNKIGRPFSEVIVEAARNAGLGKFRVYVAGSEIAREDAPATIVEGAQIELRAYDVAG